MFNLAKKRSRGHTHNCAFMVLLWKFMEQLPKRPQLLPRQYQCVLGSQLRVAQLQALCIWFFPHTLPSSSLFLPVTGSSDPKRNPGWEKKKQEKFYHCIQCLWCSHKVRVFLQLGLTWKEKEKRMDIVFAALLPPSFPDAVCKVHHFVECSERSGGGSSINSSLFLKGCWPKIPIFQMEGAISFPGQNAGRTKAEPHNLLCSIRGEIFPEGKIQSILCHFLTSHKSLQLCKYNSSFPIQLLN